MKFDGFFDGQGAPYSLATIALGGKNVRDHGASPIDVHDAIEDAITEWDLLARLTKLDLCWHNMVVDRKTSNYVRIKGTDSNGNIYYLRAQR